MYAEEIPNTRLAQIYIGKAHETIVGSLETSFEFGLDILRGPVMAVLNPLWDYTVGALSGAWDDYCERKYSRIR